MEDESKEMPKIKILRNDKEKRLVFNGLLRPGQFTHHDENCLIEDYGYKWRGDNDFINGTPLHEIWCATHGQWAHETPIKVTYTFQNGVLVEKELWPKRKHSKIIL